MASAIRKFYTSFDGDVLGALCRLSEYARNLDELNHLACLLSGLTSSELVTRGRPTSAITVLRCGTSSIPMIKSGLLRLFTPAYPMRKRWGVFMWTIWKCWMPGSGKPYFDYEAYGRDACIHESGHLPRAAMLSKKAIISWEVYHGFGYSRDIRYSFRSSLSEQMAAYQKS